MQQPLAPPYVFPEPVQSWFRQAGWYAGRIADVQTPSGVVYPLEVLTLLREFNGLRVEHLGTFLEFNPLVSEGEYGEEEEFMYFASLGRKLYCIGQTEEYHCVCVDLLGCVYTADLGLVLHGMTFTEGITNILIGRSGQYFNEDDQTWDPDHHRIIWPDSPAAP